MTAAKQIKLTSVADYLAGELASDTKHEYLGGHVYAMAGARNVHNRIAVNWLVSMGRQLHAKPCEPFNSDTKARIQFPTHTRFYYPDGMIVCEPNAAEDTFQDKPVVIAEVISENTRRIDEGEKREAYLTIPTLSMYLLIETDQPRVVVHRRGENGFFAEVYEGAAATISLEAVDASLPLAELYERVELPTGDPKSR